MSGYTDTNGHNSNQFNSLRITQKIMNNNSNGNDSDDANIGDDLQEFSQSNTNKTGLSNQADKKMRVLTGSSNGNFKSSQKTYVPYTHNHRGLTLNIEEIEKEYCEFSIMNQVIGKTGGKSLKADVEGDEIRVDTDYLHQDYDDDSSYNLNCDELL